VSIVKPSKDEAKNAASALSPFGNGPKTSTPINKNDAMHSFSYISETGGSASSIVAKAVILSPFLDTNSTFPKVNRKSVEENVGAHLTKSVSNTNVRLATVKPQRVASVAGGTFRPFRVPEASRILFRSVRGKYGIKGWPSLPEVVAAAAANSMTSSPGSCDSTKSLPTVVISGKQSLLTPNESDLAGERKRGVGGCESTNTTNQEQSLGLPHPLSESDPAAESKLEAITIANTIANKNANKITGPRLNYPNHAEHAEHKGVPTKPAISSKPTSINSIMTSIKPTSSDPKSITSHTNPAPINTATIVGSSRKRPLGQEFVADRSKATNLAKLPPPLLRNAVLPPPPNLDDDEEDNDENGASSNDDNNNATNDQACLTKTTTKSRPVPMAAPRIQTLTKSKGHVYQNIPFTKKTPRHEV
jgi:hypothetical protein